MYLLFEERFYPAPPALLLHAQPELEAVSCVTLNLIVLYQTLNIITPAFSGPENKIVPHHDLSWGNNIEIGRFIISIGA